jgi:hypothetical protein
MCGQTVLLAILLQQDPKQLICQHSPLRTECELGVDVGMMIAEHSAKSGGPTGVRNPAITSARSAACKSKTEQAESECARAFDAAVGLKFPEAAGEAPVDHRKQQEANERQQRQEQVEQRQEAAERQRQAYQKQHEERNQQREKRRLAAIQQREKQRKAMEAAAAVAAAAAADAERGQEAERRKQDGRNRDRQERRRLAIELQEKQRKEAEATAAAAAAATERKTEADEKDTQRKQQARGKAANDGTKREGFKEMQTRARRAAQALTRKLVDEHREKLQEALEAELLAETLAESRGAREEHGARDQWKSTAHIGLKYAVHENGGARVCDAAGNCVGDRRKKAKKEKNKKNKKTRILS